MEYDGQNLYAKPISARKVVSSIVSDPLLVDMISCPLMFCGNAQENDIQFGQFVIMFKSIFCEGLARPQAGIRQILDVLVKKYKAGGGELKMKCAMTSLKCANDRVESILLENGEVLTADKILSSAGYVETMKLLTDYDYSQFNCCAGQLSFVESILVSNKEPADIGYTTTSTFYNNSDRFNYRKPDKLVDVSSGVICCPSNFQFENPFPEGIIRITKLANFDL